MLSIQQWEESIVWFLMQCIEHVWKWFWKWFLSDLCISSKNWVATDVSKQATLQGKKKKNRYVLIFYSFGHKGLHITSQRDDGDTIPSNLNLILSREMMMSNFSCFKVFWSPQKILSLNFTWKGFFETKWPHHLVE